MKTKISYAQTGVNYEVMDPLKILAQKMGQTTGKNLSQFNFKEIAESRGESAYVWEEADCYRALVIEGLGTKNLVADEMEKITNQTYYDSIAQDTVAAIVNDILTVGALPQVINAYFGTGGPDWFTNSKRSTALVEGWAKACNMAGVSWGGGETPALLGIINSQTVDLAGACVGIIKPKSRLLVGDKLQDGDAILLIESSGIHANGLSLARAVAEKLPAGYSTKLTDGNTFGETILTPTYLYVSLIKSLFEANIDIHYMVNITGHGWRKLMRAPQPFTYLINQIPPIFPIFDFIQEHCASSDSDMYGNFNMGAGFAIYLPESELEKAQTVTTRHNLKCFRAGVVQKGDKQVIIQPKNITFKGAALNLR